MSLDTSRSKPSHIDPSRRTTEQLLAASARDPDAVSIFANGTSWADSEQAIFVVKGQENIAYLRALLIRQGLTTDGVPVERALNPRDAEVKP